MSEFQSDSTQAMFLLRCLDPAMFNHNPIARKSSRPFLTGGHQ